jgi:hypothetical protein
VKKPAGQLIVDHENKNLDLEDDIIEYRRAMEKKTVKDLYETAFKVKNEPLYKNKDFYVVMTIKNEAVFRHPQTIMWARRSCPTPVYKQAVWKFHTQTDTLEFLWNIPDPLRYYHILRNRHEYLSHKEHQEMAKFVILMESGELLEWVKKENGEKKDAIIYKNKETKWSMN